MGDQERLNELSQKAAEFSKKQAEELAKKVGSLRSQSEALIHDRTEIERGLLTIEETVKLAKQKLREGTKEFFFTQFLTQHLLETQKQQTQFLDQIAVKLHFTADRNLYKWLYGIVKDEMIDEAAKELLPGGLSEKQKKGEIDSLNKKIRELENEIEKLLS
jgi:polyhydroxyalkanoate synthesis regulator phasin